MRKIYIGIVQYPMAALDETLVEVFNTFDEADKWVNESLSDEGNRNGYTVDEMNWQRDHKELKGNIYCGGWIVCQPSLSWPLAGQPPARGFFTLKKLKIPP